MKNFLVPFLVVVLMTGCTTTTPRVVERAPAVEVAAPVPPPPLPPLLKDDLVRLAKQGIAAEGIIGRIKESRTRLRLSASDVLSLKTQGVPLAVLDHLLDSDRLATADDCTAQINRNAEEARAAQAQAIQQAELMGWQRCQMSFPMAPFPGWRTYPYRR